MSLAQIDSVYTLTVQFDEQGKVIACEKVPRVRVYYDDTGETFGVQLKDSVSVQFNEVIRLLNITAQDVNTKTNPDTFTLEVVTAALEEQITSI